MHLDGSIRLETLIELAKEYRVDLPSFTPGGLRETVFWSIETAGESPSTCSTRGRSMPPRNWRA